MRSATNNDGVTLGSIPYYAQASEPTLSQDNQAAFWKDTDDSNRVYFVFRRGSGDQIKIELV
jgi:hypothetical protein